MTSAKYNVVIAGGGIAGLITATSIAHHSKQNVRVLVLDRNEQEEPGKKTHNGWTCGDATSKRSLQYLEERLGIKYSYPELEHQVKGVYVFSPDRKSKVLFEGEGYLLNRKLLPKKQVQDAKKLGVEFMYNSTAERLIHDDNRIVGVEGRKADGSIFKIYADVVIDATGASSVLRKFLPVKSYIEREIDMDDMVVTGRYILEFDPAYDDRAYFDPDYCIIHLDQFMAPAGYCAAPDTPVICKSGIKPIQQVKMGDEVLTSVGWIPVSATSMRSYEGQLIVIIPLMLNQPIKLTPEHLVRVWNPIDGETWKRADELLQGKDYLVVTIPPQTKKPLEYISTLDYIQGIVKDGFVYTSSLNKNGSYTNKTELVQYQKTGFPSKMPITEDFMELCGLYVSNGSIKEQHVVLSCIDKNALKHIYKIASRLGYNFFVCDKFDRGRANTILNIEFDDTQLAELIGKCFGRDAENKKIPSWVHEISRKAKVAFLKGFFQYNVQTGEKGILVKDSNAIVIAIWFLLVEAGFVPSIKTDEEGTWLNWIPNSKDVFSNEKASLNKEFVSGDGRLYLGIKEIKKEKYSGPVYDINSGGDFSTLFNIHNCWIFPKGKNKVNIGLGVSKSGLERRNRIFGMRDTLQSLIDKYVKDNPTIKNPRQPNSESDSGNTKGNWQVPVRRHNDCMVADGFAIVGDAAWMPRPIDAGGISPAIYGGTILGKVVAEAIEAKDTSTEGLWSYNVEYMKVHGFPMASFEVLRRYLQTITNEQLNYGMKYFLSEEDVQAITERRHPEFSKVRALNPVMWFRILYHLPLARGLRYTVEKSRKLVEINLNYPEKPSGFEEWKRALMKELNETVEKFKPIGA